MSGFGYAEGEVDGTLISVGIKSLNNRYLDMLVFLPPSLSVLEGRIRDELKPLFKRGRVDVTIRAGLSTLKDCTRDVKRQFAKNDLLLNADKSEVMMIGTPAQLRDASTVNTVAVADANLTHMSA